MTAAIAFVAGCILGAFVGAGIVAAMVLARTRGERPSQWRYYAGAEDTELGAPTRLGRRGGMVRWERLPRLEDRFDA